MISTRLITLLALLTASLPLTESAPLDVWVPKITHPDGNTVWYTGDQATVTWDVTKAPSDITNPKGQIYLVVNGLIKFQYHLASNFDLRLGRVEIKVPEVNTGKYRIVLIGDSGDDSPVLTIIKK